jgi:two-component system phosphate regulon sensor histidine kinase PhoR
MMSEPLNVLVIDDEEGMREGIKRILIKRGFKVELAKNGEEAIELLGKKMYDIAFVDLKMPGIDGFKVTAHINEKFGNRTVVVIVSALATVEAAVEVTRHGAFDFLVKPFTPSDLIQVTDRAVQQSGLVREREEYLSQLNGERNLSRQIINAMQEGLLVLNIRGEAVLMNPKAEFFLNTKFKPSVHARNLIFDKNLVHSIEETVRLEEDKDGARKRKGITRVFQYMQNGTMLQVRVDPLVREGRVNGAIMIVQDTTEAWKAEQDKSRFVSMVAHELKSPLAAIINYINVIQTGMFDNKPEKVHELLERCNIRGEALLELIGDLLYINKRDAGKIEKSIEELDLAEVLRKQLDFYRVQADKRSINLEFSNPGEPVLVRADRGDLDRIFMNLISNGLKYNRDGGTLTVIVEQTGDAVVTSFRDTGIGMSRKDVANLFQEFFRVRNSKTGSISGTGLGLATVKRVLSEYNARITVESEEDVGSTFTVYFPSS